MKISDLMSKPVVTVEPDDALSVVSEIFNNTHFHHLLVVEKSKLVGVVSDRDWLKALSPNLDTASEQARDRATLNKRVHQIMSRHPVTLSVESNLVDIIKCFDEHIISCIPIVDETNKPIGIVSWRDLIKLMRQRVKQKEA
ncbi:CBS domain-containing protein [Catenovulum adriaticum]|uniref:CBS domain-containing protein n=1 Tax=Catenovulum adriaticum TaxID=2984846 RepID=A0ABY7AKE8_9ALTE|nr:CBS domain-containing protein [Catenovulum sp. TS8]WAJ69222.1 CBS domain-containing protein [Catenovulum sp. TS8]